MNNPTPCQNLESFCTNRFALVREVIDAIYRRTSQQPQWQITGFQEISIVIVSDLASGGYSAEEVIELCCEYLEYGHPVELQEYETVLEELRHTPERYPNALRLLLNASSDLLVAA